MISVRGVNKGFATKKTSTLVLSDVNIELKQGEFCTVFGPNGSGKTTLLNIVAGVEKQDAGCVLINNKRPENARVGFVFQNYHESLFPWRTVFENITFPLEIDCKNLAEQERVASHLLEKVGLLKMKDRYVYELSGGQRQLVSICRAIAPNPDVLIMDEPFSALDYSTTRKMELELLDIWQEKKITTLFVSHDVDEAIFLADKVVVLSPRPAKVKKVFKVKLSRPRSLDMFSSKEFIKLRNAILECFDYV